MLIVTSNTTARAARRRSSVMCVIKIPYSRTQFPFVRFAVLYNLLSIMKVLR